MSSQLMILAILSLSAKDTLGSMSPSPAYASVLPPESSIAMFAGYTDEELVRDSDIILQGELVEVTQIETQDGTAQTVGVLRVNQVLKGELDKSSIFLGLPGPIARFASNSISYQTGQDGIWFLHLKASMAPTVHWADHPQRFRSGDISSPELAKIRTLVQLID